MLAYYIRRQVYFASEDDAVIFLDLPSDRYSMLVGMKAQAFHTMLAITSDSPRAFTIRVDDTNAAESQLNFTVLKELLESHLLTSRRADAALSHEDIPLPERDVMDSNDSGALQVTARDIWRFTVSCVAAAWRLKFRRMQTTVSSLELRKSRAKPAGLFDLAEVRRLVRLYKTMRPFFPRDYLCLFDSLSLVEFLSWYRCYPDMIFAVKLDPWAAHCWVQYGTVALNQDIGEAHTYLPIMAV